MLFHSQLRGEKKRDKEQTCDDKILRQLCFENKKKKKKKTDYISLPLKSIIRVIDSM